MYQLQAEYLCDISEFFAPRVPYAAIAYSDDAANTILDHSILGGAPGWVCGEPRPL